MLNTIDPELCSLITNVCKSPKNFDFPETALHFMFIWFEEIPWVCFYCWEDRTYCLACVLFDYKNVGKSLKTLKRPNQTWKTLKTLKKHQNILTGTHKKRQILLRRYFIGRE